MVSWILWVVNKGWFMVCKGDLKELYIVVILIKNMFYCSKLIIN